MASAIRYSSFRVLFPPPASPVQSSRLIQISGPSRCCEKRRSGCIGVGKFANGKRLKSSSFIVADLFSNNRWCSEGLARAESLCPHSSSVPARYNFTSPLILTRSPSTVHRIQPPRALNCLAVNFGLLSFAAQYGASVQWIEPVAGSSSIPTDGGKNRHT